MSNFYRRLKYYGIGFGIGLIFLFFFFKNRGCSWLPENRVKNAISERVILVPASQQAEFDRRQMDVAKINQIINEGNVSFLKSDKRGPNKRYQVNYRDTAYYFTLPDESFISSLYFSKIDREKERKEIAQPMGWFKKVGILGVDSTHTNICILNTLKINSMYDLEKILVKKGKIDFSQSDFSDVSKPIHHWVLPFDDTLILRMNTILYKNQIYIQDFPNFPPVKCD